LDKDPKNRIGVNDKDEIKSHPFFSEINWDLLYQRKTKPPIDLVECKRELNSSMTVNN
jgi:hypothetical protein